MEKVIEKMNQWLKEEQEILDELAHDVACSENVEGMVKAQSNYNSQNIKVLTIIDAIELVKNTK